jgi:hypothetical protein
MWGLGGVAWLICVFFFFFYFFNGCVSDVFCAFFCADFDVSTCQNDRIYTIKPVHTMELDDFHCHCHCHRIFYIIVFIKNSIFFLFAYIA